MAASMYESARSARLFFVCVCHLNSGFTGRARDLVSKIMTNVFFMSLHNGDTILVGLLASLLRVVPLPV
ncbi:hypothetical protein MGG_17352 [Pyricularia oryzae 70-15]|uniref:Uncharacterized protein n=1 Tax=Pyricularia oryzae (strain 70-15 / ATCC MYA-4617 / FGSC 8958) TaxID=242507 RepID=G4NDS2_PYRO7|nr:uncharacterized protein MGG_17352 [Pyricularia oryzae 70-15]EHA48510.1 hypothetical protein MGG_17352 [Pyricularia oryzae 70-15]